MVCKNNAMGKLVAAVAIFISCSTTKQMGHMNNNTGTILSPAPADTGFLSSLLNSKPAFFADILKNHKDWNVQIIYTQVNRPAPILSGGANGIPELAHHYYNVDANKYFYPASTVKLPIVLLALQKLNELKDKGIDMNTTMLTETAFSGQTAVFNDPSTVDGRPTVAHYIKKILMVSDNDAFNRLYEFLGQEYIHTEMKKKGYADVEILHRLNIFLTEEENRSTNPVKFYDGSTLVYEQPAQKSEFKYAARKDSIGKGYYKGDKLINGSMDFSKKNRIGLEDLHKILISLVFPDKVKAKERFNITETDRRFVLKYMSQYPTESLYPPYAADTLNYWPAYCKFLLFGAQKGQVPENIRIFNKVGDAYGHMIDVAYIVDYKNKIEFFVSALIYCNSDGILNDDKYDYDLTGKPFMQNLGKILYDYELQRNYKNRPDLSPVLFTYDDSPPTSR
ncbi:MAG: serine hydrolase [Ferruginibacter sp.]